MSPKLVTSGLCQAIVCHGVKGTEYSVGGIGTTIDACPNTTRGGGGETLFTYLVRQSIVSEASQLVFTLDP